jgi:hypothetical protein
LVRQERRTRMGCGFVFGSIATLLALAGWDNLSLCCTIAVLVGLLFAVLAVRFGDVFWEATIRAISRW